MNGRLLAVAGFAGVLALSGCASEAGTPAASSGTPTVANADTCGNGDLGTMTPGTLTIATDQPAFEPYFVDSDPSNGKGFESAVAYAVAGKLGYATENVTWVTVPFNKVYAPGQKDFDFDINQVSITPKRAEKVTFSDGYYTVNQAVVALDKSPIAGATSIEELRTAKLGAQVGTTSLQFIQDVVQPEQEPFVYETTVDAKSALEAGQVDGIVVDLPTAYYVTAVEFDNAKIVGQFRPEGEQEQFGLVMEKGSPLAPCVNWALTELKSSGELEAIQDKWLAGESAPYFTEGGETPTTSESPSSAPASPTS